MNPLPISVAPQTQAPAGCVDLASLRVGGRALACSDDFFASMQNLLNPDAPVFRPDEYTDRGKWMDGWESRRKRSPYTDDRHDWCVIALGIRGVVRQVDINTSFFLGNHPPQASIEACCMAGDSVENAAWVEILPRLDLKPGAANVFDVKGSSEWTHLRLKIFPDGGVARLRVFGEARPDWRLLSSKQPVDLAAIENGGVVLACNDMFFGPKDNLIMPGHSKNMGDGWETKRKRGQNLGQAFDWVIVKLGHRGRVRKIYLDTAHFKGNYPERASIDVCDAPSASLDDLMDGRVRWRTILGESALCPDSEHLFEKELRDSEPVTHLRLKIYPDGGVSRLRAFGTPETQA